MTKVTNVVYRNPDKPDTEMRGYNTFLLQEGCAIWTWQTEQVIIPLIQIAEMVSINEEESDETSD